MTYITPAKFKKIVKQVTEEQTLATGKGYDFNIDETQRIIHGRAYKLVSVWLVKDKEFTVRVDYQQGDASVFVFSQQYYLHRSLPDWSPRDLIVISRAVALAGKIIEQVMEEKGKG